jgi:hypothetical protein
MMKRMEERWRPNHEGNGGMPGRTRCCYPGGPERNGVAVRLPVVPG